MSSELRFVSERISQSATISVNTSVAEAYPLFTPAGELKWVPGWNPCFLFPEGPDIAQGMVFQTPGRYPEESFYTWLVSTYHPESYFTEYVVWSAERTWTISVGCTPIDSLTTRATITYTFTSLTPRGTELNRKALDAIFAQDLADWEEAVHHYLATGKCIAS